MSSSSRDIDACCDTHTHRLIHSHLGNHRPKSIPTPMKMKRIPSQVPILTKITKFHTHNNLRFMGGMEYDQMSSMRRVVNIVVFLGGKDDIAV